VGPPSFTALALISLADHWPAGEDYFGPDAVTAQVVKILALMVGIFIWSLSLWFFVVAVVSCVAARNSLRFHMNWWAFVFPNVGFTLATINIGKSLHSAGIKWVGSVMTVGLVVVYLFVLGRQIRAVWTNKLLWPGRDEDNYHPEKMAKAEARGEDPECGKCVDHN